MWNALPWKRTVIDEVAEFHAQNLPKNVRVSWERDGTMIVGTVFADGNEFMTQAESADEFVEMVNDAIYAVYEVPVAYISVLGKNRVQPTPDERAKLEDAAVKKSSPKFADTYAVVAA